jgi:hypothetical protein
MASSYRVDRPSGIVLLGGSGELDYAAWERTLLAILADPAVGSRRRWLSDRRPLTRAHSFGFLEEIMDFFRAHSAELGEAQWAVLAEPGSEVARALEVSEELARSTRVRVKAFTELKPALTWLLGIYEDLEIERLQWWVEQGGA